MNFKKHISILLACILLVSNVGFAIDVHYCGDEIASVKPVLWKIVEASESLEDSCCAPKVEEKYNCCQDKVIKFQEKSENSTLTSIVFQLTSVFLLEEWKPIVFATISNFEKSEITSYYCDANAPPLFKLYHQYIFYA